MPIPFACPSCGTRLSAPDSSAGKSVTCKKCSATMIVPVPDAEVVADGGFEVVDESPPRRATVAKRPSRNDDDDDFDDRPVKRKPSKKKSGPPVLLLVGIGGGVLFLLLAAGVGYVLLSGKGSGIGGGLLGPKPPPGYSLVGESAVGATIFMPGNSKGQYVRNGPGPDAPINPNWYTANADEDVAFVAARTTGFTPGTSEAQLTKIFMNTKFINIPHFYDITSKKAVTVGGHPGLQITLVEKADVWDDTPQKADFFRDSNEEKKKRVAKEGKHAVIVVTTNGEWTYVIGFMKILGPPDPDVMKTVVESIKFFDVKP